MVSNNQNLQQLIVQPGQKLLVGQNSNGQKVIIQPAQQTAQLTGQISSSVQSIPQSVNQINSGQQQVVVNQTLPSGTHVTSGQQQPQKVIQTIVNTSNIQQQIVVGGQRIILSPGQTILTQRSLPVQNSSLVVQTSNSGQMCSLQKTSTQQASSTVQQNVSTTKVLKQFVIPQTSNSNSSDIQSNQSFIKPQQNMSQSSTNNTVSSAQLTSNQQIIVQNSTLAQQLAQGKLQVATINGQQVIIKPLGNNQAQIVAHIKTQSDGNAHIVTNTPIDNQTSSTKNVSVSNVVSFVKFVPIRKLICFLPEYRSAIIANNTTTYSNSYSTTISIKSVVVNRREFITRSASRNSN